MITSYKGFDKDLKCRGFQYEIGGEYEQGGEIRACRNGFHACEIPIDVFKYYDPAGSRFCVVNQSGDMDRGPGSDSKVASQKIKIGAEIGIPGLVKAQIEYVKAHTTTEHTDPKMATSGDFGAATAGNNGAATAGNFGAATAGDMGAATAGDRGFSLSGRKSRVGENGVAVSRGLEPMVMGGIGSTLVAVRTDVECTIVSTVVGTVDGKTLKPDVWYTVKDGSFVEMYARR